MYIQHVDTVKPYCDMTIDGTKNITDIVNDILKEVYKHERASSFTCPH